MRTPCLTLALALITFMAAHAQAEKPALVAQADTLLACDFDDAQWWRAWGLTGLPTNTDLVARQGQGTCLRVTIPQGTNTGGNFHYRFQKQLGQEPEAIYFAYDLKIDPSYKQAVDGGKLPGFSGTYGKAGWGGRKVHGDDGWSARGSFRKPGETATEIGFYCYHADMRGTYGNIWTFDPPLEYDRWYRVETWCQLNTPGEDGSPGQADGVLAAWLDGRPAFRKADIRFRDVERLKIESIWVNVYHGGTRPTPADLHLFIDNVVIARELPPRLGENRAGEP